MWIKEEEILKMHQEKKNNLKKYVSHFKKKPRMIQQRSWLSTKPLTSTTSPRSTLPANKPLESGE